MNEKSFNKLSSSQRYNITKLNKSNRLASMSKTKDILESNLDYYTWPMLHDAYTGKLNDLGIRVMEEKKRRGLI